MATTVTIPLTTLTVGVHDFGPASISDALVTSVLTIDRTVTNGGVQGLNSQPASTTVALQIMQSNDGGATWTLIVGSVLTGGQVLLHGTPMTTSVVNDGFLAGTGRQVKATVTVSGASVAVQGSLALS